MGCHKNTNNAGAQSEPTYITAQTQKLEKSLEQCPIAHEVHMTTQIQ